MSVYSIYVEKKPPFAVEAAAVLGDLCTALQIKGVERLRLVCRYFVEDIRPEDLEAALHTIFSEPQVDILHDGLPRSAGARVFAAEYLPGQFDQRADSCAQCIALMSGGERPVVRTAKIYIMEGNITDSEFAAIKAYLINPVDSREASFEVPATLAMDFRLPDTVDTLTGFTGLGEEGLEALHRELGLAMDMDDLRFCRKYFKEEEKRDPTITEVRMIDTYWSDHCRHTTFLTEISEMDIGGGCVRESYEKYLTLRDIHYRDRVKPVTLMDMATIGAKELRRQGLLNRLDESDEINACSVNVSIQVDRQPEDWLLMFKNETHNHPTEIEPFGGAATCLGGAIRDPLSGRSYVYQAMRVTGAGNPLEKTSETRPGKLPQRKLVQTAAAGYSSYGNQIGLATGLVNEIYHPGYVAKRMEIGAVIGAAPVANVVREQPRDGDLVILLGGRTGRDGCGGATGSSKSHDAQSLESCGAQVQKGNAPEERKLQRLFRNPAATTLIKRCNDFGAGGVAVSIGELADGITINLDRVPKKYEGLDGTELAISESQERMSVVVSPEDADAFIALAGEENLEATVVASITGDPRLVMHWKGNTIVSLSREFLNSNGAPKQARAVIPPAETAPRDATPITGESLKALMGSLEFCSQKGLVERFDSTIGANTVLLPFGGRYQATPSAVMAAKFPVLGGEADSSSLMAWGFDPVLSSESPYHGAMYAVVHSVAKIIAAGGTRRKCWLTFQEYFERLGEDPARWGKPAAALLGALEAQLQLQLAAVGGKDSMSGSFEELHVPPTLVSFAVGVAVTDNIISNEFKRPGNIVYLLKAGTDENGLPDFDDTRIVFDLMEQFISEKGVLSAWALGAGGTAAAVAQMCFGNRVGFEAKRSLDTLPGYGSFLVESAHPLPQLDDLILGFTIPDYAIHQDGERIDLEEIQSAWEGTLEPVFPARTPQEGPVEAFTYHPPKQPRRQRAPATSVAVPRVVIPVFPGTNCEYDTAMAFQRAGAKAQVLVVRNLTSEGIARSADELSALLDSSQILAIPGGFSGGDEPDGSAKFITALLRSPRVSQSLNRLLEERDGLICGICNGFQALVKLGLLPFGEIRAPGADSPTLTYNTIGRHQAGMVHTRISSNKSPWLSFMRTGDIYTIPVSHGEGRFVAEEALIRRLAENGQIATQYVDLQGNPTQDVRYNPNNSAYAIEAITSPDGRILGKMGHNERWSPGIYKNIPETGYMDMFKGAVMYYK